MAGRAETKQYWIEQLSEYLGSGFTIHVYCELKELSFENTLGFASLKEANQVLEKSVSASVEVLEPPRLEMGEVSSRYSKICLMA